MQGCLETLCPVVVWQRIHRLILCPLKSIQRLALTSVGQRTRLKMPPDSVWQAIFSRGLGYIFRSSRLPHPHFFCCCYFALFSFMTLAFNAFYTRQDKFFRSDDHLWEHDFLWCKQDIYTCTCVEYWLFCILHWIHIGALLTSENRACI